jgi:NADPH-dependent curcumin reductase CurA
MTAQMNLQVLLASRPRGWPTEDNFRFVETAMPSIGDGQVLVRGLWLSLDPYMRGRMNEGPSYVKPVGARRGDVRRGRGRGDRVASSEVRGRRQGAGDLGWQQYAVSNGKGLRKLAPRSPLTAQLSGRAAWPGITAYVGLLDLGRPEPGQTVVVSAPRPARSAAWSARSRSSRAARAVGIAGGPDKCRFVTEQLGFDACLDYKAGNLPRPAEGGRAAGRGRLFRQRRRRDPRHRARAHEPFGRVPICGLISQYNATEPYGVKNFRAILVNRMQRAAASSSSTSPSAMPPALVDLAQWLAAGSSSHHETIAKGCARRPQAFLGMLRGANLGKQLVKLA